MTNQEIIIEIPLPCELNTADLNRVMNEARADEREKVIREIEDIINYKIKDPANDNVEIGDAYRFGVADCLQQIKREIIELKSKLNSLREAI